MCIFFPLKPKFTKKQDKKTRLHRPWRKDAEHCPAINPAKYLSIYLSRYINLFYPSIYPFTSLSIPCTPTCPPIHLLSINFIHLSIYLSIHLSTHLSVCLCVCACMCVHTMEKRCRASSCMMTEPDEMTPSMLQRTWTMSPSTENVLSTAIWGPPFTAMQYDPSLCCWAATVTSEIRLDYI